MQMTLTRRVVFSIREVIVALKHAYPDQVEVQMLPDNATRTDVKHVHKGRPDDHLCQPRVIRMGLVVIDPEGNEVYRLVRGDPSYLRMFRVGDPVHLEGELIGTYLRHSELEKAP